VLQVRAHRAPRPEPDTVIDAAAVVADAVDRTEDAAEETTVDLPRVATRVGAM
jgi:hypothetical protein